VVFEEVFSSKQACFARRPSREKTVEPPVDTFLRALHGPIP